MAKVCNYNNIEFWAENGVVYILDKEKAAAVPSGTKYTDLELEQRNRIFKGLPPKEFLKRAYAMAVLEVNRCEGYPSEESKLRKFIDDFRSVYKQALEQGAIDDPKAIEYKTAHKNSFKKKLVLPVQIVPQHKPSFVNRDPKDILFNGLSE